MYVENVFISFLIIVINITYAGAPVSHIAYPVAQPLPSAEPWSPPQSSHW